MMPMDKTSTTMTNEKIRKQEDAPSSRTLNFIRQFARIYMPVAKMPGFVLN